MSESLKYHKKAHTINSDFRFIQQITWKLMMLNILYSVGVRVNEAD